MRNKILFLLIILTSTLTAQSVIDPDNIVVGANEMPTGISTDSVFYFHKETMSWRAGYFENGTAQPNDNSRWSAAWGYNNTIQSSFTTAWGFNNIASDNGATVWGEYNTVDGKNSTAFGFDNKIYRHYSTAWGYGHRIHSDFSTAWGQRNNLNGSIQTAFGSRNDLSGSLNTVWGQENTISDTCSTAWGSGNIINAHHSTAWGKENTAAGSRSTVWGTESQANGDLTTVWGSANRADSTGATTWGVLNRSLNYQATSWGRDNQALGIHSTAIGEGNGTRDKNSLVAGQFNEFYSGGLSAPNTNSGDTIFTDTYDNVFTTEDYHQLFIVGNGTDDKNRSNAITVTESGRLGIGVSLPASALNLKSNEELRFGPTASITGAGHTLTTNSSIIPTSHSRNLGTSSNRWGRVYTVAGVVTTSDIRLKENIQAVDKALDKIENLHPIYYNLISHPDESEIGFSAQELEIVLPEVVRKEQYINENGKTDYHYGVNYDKIIPVLTRAIQEQQQMIDQSNLENDLLESELEIIKKNIAELQAILKTK